MSRKDLLIGGLILLYLLHNDLWLWNDGTMVLGIPVGLFYHVAYCFVTMGWLWLMVRFAWPFEDDEEAAS